MIKVRVVRGIQTGLPLASSLVAVTGGIAGCAADDSTATSGENNLTTATVDPGTGSFELGYAYGTTSGYTFVASGADEYVRAGEKMTFAIPGHYLWSWLYPGQPFPSDPARVKQISATVKISFLRNSFPYASATAATSGWQGTTAYDLKTTTASFAVDARAETMRFALEITDAAGSSKTLSEGAFLDQFVLGGMLPNKTALFDTMGATYRGRILEGGSPVAGAKLAIAYTDWRAATLVDSTSIDRNIGTMKSYSRFGEVDMPLQGNLEYDIAYKLVVDGQVQEEKLLTQDTASKLLPSNRVAYDTVVDIPAGAKDVSVSFHVRAYVRADYTGHEMTNKKYEDGARIQVRDVVDGTSNTFTASAQ